MRALLLFEWAAALSFSLSANCSLADPMTDQKFFEKIFETSGFFLRSGTVCEEQAKDFINLSFKIQTLDDEVRVVGKSFPELTAKWMTNGASMMNGLVLEKGVKTACLVAYMQLVQVGSAIVGDQKRQGQH